MKVFYSDDYTAAKYDFDTTRKARAIAEDLRGHALAGLELAVPRSVTSGELCQSRQGVCDASNRASPFHAGSRIQWTKACGYGLRHTGEWLMPLDA